MMKSCIHVLSFLAVGMVMADESAVLIGPVADGSPQPPVPETVKPEIRPEDVISTKVTDLGDRKITIRKIVPLELPQVPEAAVSGEARVASRAGNQAIPERVVLMMSVSVHRSESYPGKVRTLFRWWSQDRTREFQAWSNVDGCWLSGFGEFKAGGKQYALVFVIGEQDVDKIAAAMARHGAAYTSLQIPELPQDGPAFVVTSGSPTPDEVAPIQAVHNLIRNEGERLRLAYEGRKQAEKARAQEEKTHPQKPKDIVLNCWRIEKPKKEEGQQ